MQWRAAVRRLAGYGLLAALLVTGVAYYQQRDIPRDLAPALAGRSIDGRALDLREMTQQGPVLIYFWATWCGYCRLVSPAVSELSSEHQVISVALQSGGDGELIEYQRKHALDFPTINDPSGALSHAWGVRVTPTVVIVDREGRVSRVTSGITSKLGLQLRLSLAE